MRGIARIRYAGGILMLPANTPYDREELFSRLDSCVGHYPSVRLELNGGYWTVCRAGSSAAVKVCRACDGECTPLVFASGAHRVLCGRCMRLVADQPGKRLPPVTARARHSAAAGDNSKLGGA